MVLAFPFLCQVYLHAFPMQGSEFKPVDVDIGDDDDNVKMTVLLLLVPNNLNLLYK